MLALLLLACWRDDVADLKTDVKAVDDDVATVDDRVADLEARLADAEARLAAAEGALTATADDIEDHDARLVELETRADEAEEDLLTLSGNQFGNDLHDNEQDTRLAELEDAIADLGGASGGGGLTMATASRAEDYTQNTTTTWMSIVGDLTLTLDAAGPIVAWCSATSNGSSTFRVRIESADGAWTSAGEAVNDGGTYQNYWNYVDESFTAVGAFSAPSAGDYTLSCEAYYTNGMQDITFVAIGG